MQLSTKYGTAYTDMLRNIDEKYSGSEKLCLFWPVITEEYVRDRGTLVLGITGLTERFWEYELGTGNLTTKHQELISTLRDYSASEVPRLNEEWDKNKARNQFGKLLTQIANAAPFRQICWSNLLKVSHLGGTNPKDDLRDAEFEGCVELLKLELEELRPARVLVFGKGWYPEFLKKINFTPPNYKGERLVEAAGKREGIPWVCAKHPRWLGWKGNYEEIWQEICGAFESTHKR